MSIRSARLLLLLAALSAISLTASAQGGNQNPAVIPPDAKYRGLTYGEWTAEWWQAAFGVPVEGGSHPFIVGGAFEGESAIVFLVGTGRPDGLSYRQGTGHDPIRDAAVLPDHRGRMLGVRTPAIPRRR